MEQNGERGQQEKGVVLAIKQEQQVGEGQQTVVNNQQVPRIPQKQCPRCNSVNTKFSYYNNHSPNQPRYHCKTCEREWTEGGSLRDIPIGGTSRKDKQPSKRDYSSADALSNMLSDAAKIVLNPTSSVKTKEPMTICAFPVAPIAHAPSTYNSCSGFLSAVPTVPPSECLTSIGDFALSGGLNFHPDVLQQQQQRHLEQEQNRRQQMQQQRLLQQQQHRMQQMQQQWQLQQQLHRQQQLQQQRLLELQIQLLQQRQQELQQQQQLILHQQRQQELQPQHQHQHQHQQIQFPETSSSDTIENTVSQWFPENVPFTTSDLQEIFKDGNNVLGPEAVSRSGSNEIENKDINGSPMNPYYWPDFDPPPLS